MLLLFLLEVVDAFALDAYVAATFVAAATAVAIAHAIVPVYSITAALADIESLIGSRREFRIVRPYFFPRVNLPGSKPVLKDR